jgi:hypothetical protein
MVLSNFGPDFHLDFALSFPIHSQKQIVNASADWPDGPFSCPIAWEVGRDPITYV